VGLKDARNVVVLLAVGTEKRHFRHDLEQKTGSADIKRLRQWMVVKDGLFFSTSTSSTNNKLAIIPKKHSFCSFGPRDGEEMVKWRVFRSSDRRRLRSTE